MNNVWPGPSSGGSAGYSVAAGDSWLLSRSNPNTRLRLFCLPYAGGGASVFRNWPVALPPEVDVCPIQLPGRETRSRERPFDRLGPLVEALMAALEPRLQVPFAFFGHSMGALISFEVTRALRRRGQAGPVQLFVSGHRAPQLPDPDPPLHDLPKPELLVKLAQLKGTPKEVLENPEIMEYLLPLLRNDLALCETYQYTREARLPCPISVFGGIDDWKTPYEVLVAWQDQTDWPCQPHLFPGHHFFLQQAQPEILKTLAEELRHVLKRI